jgi:Tol biopolymer transport system component
MEILIKISRKLMTGYLFLAMCSPVLCQETQRAIIDKNSIPTVFAPGVVSTPFEEGAVTFTPNGKTVYFYQGTVYMTICFSTQVNGRWTKPKIASFSGKWSDWDPFLSPDGMRLYFVSNRPLDSTLEKTNARKSHIWFTDYLDSNHWSVPQFINAPFNLDGIGNYAPTVSKSGTLFFYSPQRNKAGKAQSYYAKWLSDHYDEPKAFVLNGIDEISDPFIAPNESYIIFVSGNDLYISYSKGDHWSDGEKLDSLVNNGDANFDPTVSPDGKMLYYSSARIKGFYKREPGRKPLDYDGLLTEMNSIFNGRSNILTIPINLTTTINTK